MWGVFLLPVCVCLLYLLIAQPFSDPTVEELRDKSSFDANGREVCIYSWESTIPKGYIVMSIEDVKNNRKKCNQKLGELEILALQDGTISGSEYEYELILDDKRKCNRSHKFLMEDDGREEELKYIKC